LPDGQFHRGVIPEKAMDFIASASAPAPGTDERLYFIFGTRHLVVNDGTVPCLTAEAAKQLPMGQQYFFGSYKGVPCYCAQLLGDDLPDRMQRLNLRAFFQQTDDTWREIAGYGRQILDLHLNFRYCGRCGTPTTPAAREHSRVCPACGLTAYPRISPAVIMAVTRGDDILLARGVRFPNKKMFSVLAGFVSPAETLEDCVRREVFEETRIRVEQVRYVRSQSWPFPDSLMIGFTARYASGDIRIDPDEILEANWFRYDDLPLIPDAHTLAGQLIRSFVRDRSAN